MLDAIEVDRTISPNDEMFTGDVDHYFSSGRSGLACIRRALAARGEGFGDPATILDFPCGHGRVLRHLRAAFPASEITACDLARDGVDFCASRFGTVPAYSDVDPSKVSLPRDHFELIWVGSLLTHVDAPRWVHFLTFFRSLLKPGGVLAFSTHGRRTHERIVDHQKRFDLDDASCSQVCGQYESTGFGYVNYANASTYGISLTEPAWVCRLITSTPEFRLVSFGEKAWDNHHDVFACVRDIDWKARCTPEPAFPRESSILAPSIPQDRPLYKRIFEWRRSA
jgi:SAM-dependent methyltransferase